MARFPLLVFRILPRNAINARLALPCSGGAAIRTRKMSPFKPSNSLFFALGYTLMKILASFSKISGLWGEAVYSSSLLLAVLKAMEARKRTPLIISQNIQVNSGRSVGITPPAVRPPRVAHTPARLPKTRAAVPIYITSFLLSTCRILSRHHYRKQLAGFNSFPGCFILGTKSG